MSSIFNFYPELKKFIPYNKKFLTDNFNKTFKNTQTLSYSNKSNLEDYEDFKKKIYNNIGTKYLPIMRISDGEMLFLTNFQNESTEFCVVLCSFPLPEDKFSEEGRR